MISTLERSFGLAMAALALAACAAVPQAPSPTSSPTAAPSPSAPTASPAASVTAPPAPTASPTAAPTASSSATTARTFPPTAPPDLTGDWETTLDNGQSVVLTLRGGSYVIDRGGATGQGSIVVTGDIIEFFGSDLCAGRGIYQWSREGETMTLVTQSEECPGRAEAIAGQTFTLR